MTDDITDTWLGRAIRDACADVARELNEERPWVCHHNDPSCRRGGYRCSDSCGPTRENIVWHHPDGRMAKLKGRDIPPAPVPPGERKP